MGSPVFGTWRSRGNRLAALILAIVIGGGAVLYWYLGTEGTDAGRTARAPGRPAVPVSVAIAARRDVPIYLIGLGAVQPTLSVGIHSQVDGKLQEVLFTEGQHIKKGDVIAKIDPRLFKAALDQAQGEKGPGRGAARSRRKRI